MFNEKSGDSVTRFVRDALAVDGITAVEVASAGYKAVAIVVARCCTFDGRGRSSWEGTVAAVAEGAVVEEAASIAEGVIDTAIVGVAGTATEGVVRIVIAA